MQNHRAASSPLRRISAMCAATAWLSLAAVSASAATPNPTEAQTRYEQQRTKCLSGQTNQDQATCLREAGAAKDETKRGNLDDHDANYRKNQKERCDVLTGDEQRDCKARMKGKGTVSGSVEGGGVVRETVTREIKPAEPAASAP